jgi:hypothetical protein
MSGSYKDLRVWQEGVRLAVAVCQATEHFPRHQLYALGDQLRRAAVSVPSNIAEGRDITPIWSSCASCFMLADHFLRWKLRF